MELKIAPDFAEFWDAYGKKRERKKCKKHWDKLTIEQKISIMAHVPVYVNSTPDKQFRKDPYRYLFNECWEDEIINKTTGSKQRSVEYTRSLILNQNI